MIQSSSLKYLLWAISLGLLTFAIGCKGTKTAQATEEETPDALLWKIEGQGLAEPSFLYGTIHIIGSDDYFMPTGLQEAFDATSQLALEIDMDDPSMAMAVMTGGMMKNDTSLQDLLDEDTYGQVSSFFTDTLGMPGAAMSAMERMQPFLLASMIYPKMLDSEMKSYEMEFMEMAKAAKKEVVGLEDFKDQFDMIHRIPYGQQAEMLSSFVTDFDEQKESITEMIGLYVAEDLDGLYAYILRSEDMQGYQEFMLDQRNRNWIPVMGEMAAEMPTLFAVGAGHLYGDQGVINLLKEAGYTVTAVK